MHSCALLNLVVLLQVQKRFKLHALITVGILAAVHVVCFATTLVAIGQQRASMLQLGRSVELQVGALASAHFLDGWGDRWLACVFACDCAGAIPSGRRFLSTAVA